MIDEEQLLHYYKTVINQAREVKEKYPNDFDQVAFLIQEDGSAIILLLTEKTRRVGEELRDLSRKSHAVILVEEGNLFFQNGQISFRNLLSSNDGSIVRPCLRIVLKSRKLQKMTVIPFRQINERVIFGIDERYSTF